MSTGRVGYNKPISFDYNVAPLSNDSRKEIVEKYGCVVYPEGSHIKPTLISENCTNYQVAISIHPDDYFIIVFNNVSLIPNLKSILDLRVVVNINNSVTRIKLRDLIENHPLNAVWYNWDYVEEPDEWGFNVDGTILQNLLSVVDKIARNKDIGYYKIYLEDTQGNPISNIIQYSYGVSNNTNNITGFAGYYLVLTEKEG